MKVNPRLISNINSTRSKRLIMPAMQGLQQTKSHNLKELKKPMGYGAMCASIVSGFYYFLKSKKPTNFMKTLAKSMSVDTGQKVKPNTLASIMGGDELFSLLPQLKKENYIYNLDNVNKGIFRADLHSHSTYSDGNGQVQTILDDAANYADKLYAKTKQKFIFALTDHDTMDGVKEALKIIASNPKRYKNLQLVPGIEVSFAHSSKNSSNPCEMSEVLVYGVNPYSEKVTKFIENIRQKRENMVKTFISEAGKRCPLTKFSFEEFSKYYEFEKYGNVMNIHWRAYHYVQAKHAATIQASKIGQEPQAFFENIMKGTNYPSIQKLRESGKLGSDMQDAPEFNDILRNVAPHFENGKIIAQSENTFEEVIEAFKDESNIFMSYAHPYYFTEYTGDIANTLKYFTENSKGLIKASESYHQAYTPRVDMTEVEEIQAETTKLNLLHTGGRDNHEVKLF